MELPPEMAKLQKLVKRAIIKMQTAKNVFHFSFGSTYSEYAAMLLSSLAN